MLKLLWINIIPTYAVKTGIAIKYKWYNDINNLSTSDYFLNPPLWFLVIFNILYVSSSHGEMENRSFLYICFIWKIAFQWSIKYIRMIYTISGLRTLRLMFFQIIFKLITDFVFEVQIFLWIIRKISALSYSNLQIVIFWLKTTSR